MTSRDALVEMPERLPDERIDQLLDYARYLTWHEERRVWREYGRSQIAKAYGEDEPGNSDELSLCGRVH